ncbi:hypothetical protein F2Q70_00005854 [Brassica cretica]|uniref:RING-type E3 ubiquitin transferase n=1 Tax=Brassica cretica TaxID=69181 RepID=A0A8S9J419_BRACR|nr:hypothetical protein F2Q70_00005854 [Brassica cretica]
MVPQFPEAFKPTQVPFQKGTAQKFVQPSGTGTDLDMSYMSCMVSITRPHKMMMLRQGEDSGDKECVICLTEPKDTAVMPCRHLCLCSDCAKELRFQSNKCPICRQPIDELLMIKVETSNEQH